MFFGFPKKMSVFSKNGHYSKRDRVIMCCSNRDTVSRCNSTSLQWASGAAPVRLVAVGIAKKRFVVVGRSERPIYLDHWFLKQNKNRSSFFQST